MGSNQIGSQILQSGIAGAPLQVLIDKFASFAQKEIGLLLDANDEFKKLQRTLFKVQALVDNVQTKQLQQQQWSCSHNHKALQLWLGDVRSVLLHADDFLEDIDMEFVKLHSRTDHVELTNRDKVSTLVFPRFKFGIPHEMAKIRHKLEDIAREMDGLFVDEVVNLGQPSLIGKLQTTSLVDKSCVIGRDGDITNIKNMLLDESSSVISIEGMAGVGKTTLAQLVYNHEEVVNCFKDSRIWVSVSMNDTVERVTKSIIECASGELLQLSDLDPIRTKYMHLDPIQTRLLNMLNKKKFLIVLDNMWNENASYWDLLRLPFKDAATGSKILVTTRSMTVSRIVASAPPYHVQTLSDQECWALIRQRALPSINEDEHKDLEDIGFKIAEKCKGLPLAARVIGSALRFKSDEMEWEAILKSKLWIADNGNEILPALKLSYDNLPPCLQKCFAYCSIFPANFQFNRDDLVQLWVGEGFIQEKAMRRLEDIGKEYFDALFSRSLFQEHSEKQGIYTMHDLVHDLAEFVSDEICFRMEDHMSLPLPKFKNIRHSSLVCKDIQLETWKVFENCDHLRTFLLLSEGGGKVKEIPHGFFLKIRHTRVLNLSCTNIKVLPDSIENLIHLRYLDVSRTPIQQLPETITKLYYLETIKLNNCLRLFQLPKGMKNLTNLRHLEVDMERQIRSMPMEFGKLTNLQTLSAFIVGNQKGQGIEELKNMRCLRGSLCIKNLENVTNFEEDHTPKLYEKPYLDKLELQWDETTDGHAAGQVLAKLQPHNKIKELIIRGYGGFMFPGWLNDPSFYKLQIINLINCCNCTLLHLDCLAQLPMLRSLYMHDMPELVGVDSTLTGFGRFPSLSELTFHNMPKLETWTGLTSIGDMPKLCQLKIWDCASLNSFPSLGCLTSLETLDISRCPQLQSLPDGEIPQSLKSLIIAQSESFKRRCLRRDWIRISFIPYIEIDNEEIQATENMQVEF